MDTISYEKLEQLVEEFSDRRWGDCTPDFIKKLLITGSSSLRGNEPFLNRLQDRSIDSRNLIISQEDYEVAVMYTVKEYTRDKDKVIKLFQALTEYLKRKADVDFTVHYPPIPSGNTFERLMYISKYLHDPAASISELEDILWVSGRTIENDLRKLRGDDDPIQVCGRKYIVSDIRRSRGTHSLPSTPHPFFLACNLTQVIAILKGLKFVAEEPAFHAYAMKTASEIWEQLSDYAKARILYVIQELMPDEEIHWYHQLGETDEKAFWAEKDCSASGKDALLECLKNGFPCLIILETGSGKEILENVQIKKYYGDTVLILHDGAETTLKTQHILQVIKN